ncbi:hypothetical protein GCM10023311_22810 [Flaviramulus aquimarinus]|uniref:EF-hand domain-containing protein n=1 Tax=Flaviramulus aquimarinus TaxID=1170456 RepID=A0ABP9FB86_9FLAO
MASKKSILKKVQIVITKHFKTPEDAFNFFDKNGNRKLSKKEIVALLKEAEINGFIRGLVTTKLIEGYDKDGDGLIDWKEFKAAVAEIVKGSK